MYIRHAKHTIQKPCRIVLYRRVHKYMTVTTISASVKTPCYFVLLYRTVHEFMSMTTISAFTHSPNLQRAAGMLCNAHGDLMLPVKNTRGGLVLYALSTRQAASSLPTSTVIFWCKLDMLCLSKTNAAHAAVHVGLCLHIHFRLLEMSLGNHEHCTACTRLHTYPLVHSHAVDCAM